MNRSADDEFHLRPRAPRGRQARQSDRLTTKVIRAMSRLGPGPSRGGSAKARPTLARLGRGAGAAAVAGNRLPPDARRVVIKSRIVQLKRVAPQAVDAHLRYIARDGVSHDGQPSQPYGPEQDAADWHAFAEKGRQDRHQFRFIVAPEDGIELEDLRDFTRKLMTTMEEDLATRLEWIAVDHWDTDNPHTHIVLRGKDGRGEDLVIARRYMSEGMRLRACEIATQELGIRTQLEMEQNLRKDVTQQRWTELDQQLQTLARETGTIDLARPGANLDMLRHRSLLLGRLQALEPGGLARELGKGVWQLSNVFEPALKAMGEEGDIVKAMHRALGGEPRQVVARDQASLKLHPVTGRVIGSGYINELEERAYVMVDGVDGKAHHLPIGPRDPTTLPLGAIVEVSATPARPMDRNIAGMAASDGFYTTSRHREALRQHPELRNDTEEILEAYARRMEALRRAGIVKREANGIWRVPQDVAARGYAYDRRLSGGIEVKIHSHLSIDKQVTSLGATWLDRNLLANDASQALVGFGASVKAALRKRGDFLVEQGLARRDGDRLLTSRNLLTTLRQREMESLGRSIAKDTGKTYQPLIDGERVKGVYRGAVVGVSGRFAMLDNGFGFNLVPWRPVIEQKVGRQISAVVRGDYVSWKLGRELGISL